MAGPIGPSIAIACDTGAENSLTGSSEVADNARREFHGDSSLSLLSLAFKPGSSAVSALARGYQGWLGSVLILLEGCGVVGALIDLTQSYNNMGKYVAILVYPSLLLRTCMLDVRVILMLMRHFEFWFVGVSGLRSDTHTVELPMPTICS
jgi:hypothetical protein